MTTVLAPGRFQARVPAPTDGNATISVPVAVNRYHVVRCWSSSGPRWSRRSAR
jgi:hypothetical protein